MMIAARDDDDFGSNLKAFMLLCLFHFSFLHMLSRHNLLNVMKIASLATVGRSDLGNVDVVCVSTSNQ